MLSVKFERKTFNIVYFIAKWACDLALRFILIYKLFVFEKKMQCLLLSEKSLYIVYTNFIALYITGITFALINYISNITLFALYKKLMYFFFFCIFDWIISQWMKNWNQHDLTSWMDIIHIRLTLGWDGLRFGRIL